LQNCATSIDARRRVHTLRSPHQRVYCDTCWRHAASRFMSVE